MDNGTFMDAFVIEFMVPMVALGVFFFTVVGAVEVGGRIRAKVRGEKWESPFVW